MNLPVSLPQRKINKVRLQIMDYVLDNWPRVSPLLSCPAKSKSPRACFECVDVQVAECALTNPQVLEPASQKRREESTSMAKNAAESALPTDQYRDAEGWVAHYVANRKEVNDALKAIGIAPGTYLNGWTPEMKAEALVEYQTKHGWSPGGKKKKEAAAEAPVPEKKAKAGKVAETKAPASTPAAEGKAPEKISANAIFALLEEVKAGVSSIGAAVEGLLILSRDTHLMARATAQATDGIELIKNKSYVEQNYGVSLEGSITTSAPAEETEEEEEDDDDADDDDEGNDD